MKKEKEIEYIGYGRLSSLFRRIHKVIAGFGHKFAKLADKLHFEQYKMKFGEREEDIYIATYPKSGTTIMQMILYHLTTEGKMKFKHIYDVSPWIRNHAFRKKEPLKLPSPRLIKTHDKYKDFHKSTKGRFIYVYRNGMDVAVSLYHQQKNYNNPDLKFEDFVKRFIKHKAWFKHTQSWFRNKKKFPILYIRYEDLIENKRAEIERIISFCNISPDEKAIERAIKYSSFEYMKKHEKKFGDQPPENKKVFDQFIRKGKAGEGKKMFSKEQEEGFIKNYDKLVGPFEMKVHSDSH